MWRLVRNHGLLGLKFRRQHPIAGFIVDFCCPARRLVIEIDGDPHDTPGRRVYDMERSAVLGGLGYRVTRLSNDEVEELDDASLRRTLERLVIQQAFPSPAVRERGQGRG